MKRLFEILNPGVVYPSLQYCTHLRFSVAGLSVGDSMRLLQLGTAVGRDAMAVDVEYHGGLGGIGIGSAMVVDVSNLEST